MNDLNAKNATMAVTLIGADSNGNETNPMGANALLEALGCDRLDNGLTDTVKSVTAGTPVEAKVGGLVKAERKILVVVPLDGKLKWGGSNLTQSFTLEKNQPLIMQVGPNTAIWLDAVSGTVQFAIAEA